MDDKTQDSTKHSEPNLPELACLRFVGPDCLTYLQGYFTRDTTTLPAHEAVPSAICNIKGRVVANGWTAQQAVQSDKQHRTDLLFFTHTSLVASVSEFLQRYLAFSKTKIQHADEDQQLCFITAELNGQTDSVNSAAATVEGLFKMADSQLLYINTNHPSNIVHERLTKHSLRLQTPEAWHRWCVATQHPLVTAEVAEKFLPQMLGLQNLGGVDFDKGCYLGQEIVARAQHRGQVKKTITTLQWRRENSTSDTASIGADIQSTAGKNVGTLLSPLITESKIAATLPNAQAGLCLAVMPVEDDNAEAQTWRCNQLLLTKHHE